MKASISNRFFYICKPQNLIFVSVNIISFTFFFFLMINYYNLASNFYVLSVQLKDESPQHYAHYIAAKNYIYATYIVCVSLLAIIFFNFVYLVVCVFVRRRCGCPSPVLLPKNTEENGQTDQY